MRFTSTCWLSLWRSSPNVDDDHDDDETNTNALDAVIANENISNEDNCADHNHRATNHRWRSGWSRVPDARCRCHSICREQNKLSPLLHMLSWACGGAGVQRKSSLEFESEKMRSARWCWMHGKCLVADQRPLSRINSNRFFFLRMARVVQILSRPPMRFPKCPNNGSRFYPHPTECDYYIYCRSGFYSIQQCPFYHHWDVTTESCRWRRFTQCAATKRRRLLPGRNNSRKYF